MSIRLILEALSGHDYRVTWQRWAVAAHIALKGELLFTVEELYTSLKKHYPDIGLTTVYRTLDLLVDLGVIERIHVEDGLAKYCLRAPDVSSSQKLICDYCGKEFAVEIDHLGSFLRAVTQREDFTVDRFELNIHGRCSECGDRPRPARPTPAE